MVHKLIFTVVVEDVADMYRFVEAVTAADDENDGDPQGVADWFGAEYTDKGLTVSVEIEEVEA